LKGKVAIVTGGGSGLGASISEVLAAEGALVIVNYLVDEANVFKFVDQLNEKYDTRAIPLYGDITKASDVENVIARTVDIYGKVDILVIDPTGRKTGFDEKTVSNFSQIPNLSIGSASIGIVDSATGESTIDSSTMDMVDGIISMLTR